MRPPWGLEPRHVLAGALAVALLALPLLILSYDPESRLDRLRTPLCRSAMEVDATNQNGGVSLLTPDSGIRVRVTRDGEPYPAQLTLFVREPGADWRVHWSLDAPEGREIFYLARVTPGFEAQVRAVDPAGAACPGESPVLAAPAA